MRGELTKYLLEGVLCASAGLALLGFQAQEPDISRVAAGLSNAAEFGVGGAFAVVLVFLAALSRRRAD